MKEEIKIVENGICVDHQQLKNIIINEWQSGALYRQDYNWGSRGEDLYRNILSELADYIDGLVYEIKGKAQKNLGRPEGRIDWDDLYPKTDLRSIGFEVLDKLRGACACKVEELTTDDIPMILEFLDTPPGQELQAWDKWEKYWENLDYEERRKKLLENAEE